MSDAILSPNQRRTLRARERFNAKFPTPEARSEHFRQMARRAKAGRVTLSTTEVEVLSSAAAILASVLGRCRSDA
ncbi:MAG: hypothetical protein KC442_19630 [Thermomicrobiales bacterium]|nr:hypothetical protein [Thermomicrobiales bacterium]